MFVVPLFQKPESLPYRKKIVINGELDKRQRPEWKIIVTSPASKHRLTLRKILTGKNRGLAGNAHQKTQIGNICAFMSYIENPINSFIDNGWPILSLSPKMFISIEGGNPICRVFNSNDRCTSL